MESSWRSCAICKTDADQKSRCWPTVILLFHLSYLFFRHLQLLVQHFISCRQLLILLQEWLTDPSSKLQISLFLHHQEKRRETVVFYSQLGVCVWPLTSSSRWVTALMSWYVLVTCPTLSEHSTGGGGDRQGRKDEWSDGEGNDKQAANWLGYFWQISSSNPFHPKQLLNQRPQLGCKHSRVAIDSLIKPESSDCWSWSLKTRNYKNQSWCCS